MIENFKKSTVKLFQSVSQSNSIPAVDINGLFNYNNSGILVYLDIHLFFHVVFFYFVLFYYKEAIKVNLHPSEFTFINLLLQYYKYPAHSFSRPALTKRFADDCPRVSLFNSSQTSQ